MQEDNKSLLKRQDNQELTNDNKKKLQYTQQINTFDNRNSAIAAAIAVCTL